MARYDAQTQLTKAEQAQRVLRLLLRTPKNRQGLVAAAKTHGVTEHFVFGFLSVAQSSGEVILMKSCGRDLYQLAKNFKVEQPAPGDYPTWLDPRTLPGAAQRRVFFAGKPAQEQVEEEDDTETEVAD